MGGRLLKKWLAQPLTQWMAIVDRQMGVAELAGRLHESMAASAAGVQHVQHMQQEALQSCIQDSGKPSSNGNIAAL